MTEREKEKERERERKRKSEREREKEKERAKEKEREREKERGRQSHSDKLSGSSSGWISVKRARSGEGANSELQVIWSAVLRAVCFEWVLGNIYCVVSRVLSCELDFYCVPSLCTVDCVCCVCVVCSV